MGNGILLNKLHRNKVLKSQNKFVYHQQLKKKTYSRFEFDFGQYGNSKLTDL